MRFSVWISSGHGWPEILELARTAEAQGWDGIWLPDHFMLPEDGYGRDWGDVDPELVPVHEAWSLMAGLAATVPRVTIGVLVSAAGFRHPAVVAKMAATIDHISGGRTILGIGAGWQENEHRRYGLDLLDPGPRSDRLEEAAAVLSSLLGPAERSTFRGRHFTLDDAPLAPKPLQQPYPILVGGRGERRTLRTAARYASHWNAWGGPEAIRAKLDVLAAHCAEVGRNPAEIAVSANSGFAIHTDPTSAAAERTAMGERGTLVGTPGEIRAAIEEYRAIGVDEIVLAGFNHETPTAFATELARLGEIAR